MKRVFIVHKESDLKIKKKEYLAPSYIFVPITDKIIKQIKLDDKVLKGEYFTSRDYASVSGLIKGKKDCEMLRRKYKAIVVLNNFKEQRLRKKKSNYLNNLNDLLEKSLLEKIQKKHDNLVLNCFLDNQSAHNLKYYISDSYHDLLDCLDILKKEYNFKNIYIIVKDNEKQSIEKFIKIIGNYPEIKFITIPNIYPITNTDYVEENLNIPNSCVLSFNEFYQIFHVIHYGNNYNEVYVTVNVDGKETIVVKAKIGTLLKEIISYLKIDYTLYDIYINGLIGGYKTNNIDNLIVSKDLESISFTKNKPHKPLKCINCGNCYKYCPAKLDPRGILKKTNSSKKNDCINCGLCNYVCPVFIDLRKIVRGDK